AQKGDAHILSYLYTGYLYHFVKSCRSFSASVFPGKEQIPQLLHVFLPEQAENMPLHPENSPDRIA
ncbi:MAG: hypothetical protein ACFNYI_02535, partial [Eubacterium sp.]